MPSGTGKAVRVAVFAQGDSAKAAREAGADIVGAEDLAADIEKGNMNFDIAIATPDLMPLVGKLGRALGPRRNAYRVYLESSESNVGFYKSCGLERSGVGTHGDLLHGDRPA